MTNAQQYNQQGVAAARQGNLSEALAHYQEAIRLDQRFAEAWFNQSLTQLRLGALADAEQSLRRTISIRNDIAIVHESLGSLQIRLDRPEDAVPSFQRAVELTPKRYEAWFQLGVAEQRSGNCEQAISAYEESLKLKADATDPRINLATIHRQQGRLAAAIALLESVIDMSPTSFAAHRNLGSLYYLSGEPNRAKSCWMVARQLNDQDVDTWLQLGQLHVAESEWSQAEQCFFRASEIAPEDCGPWKQLGNLAKYLGDAANAISFYRRAAGSHDSGPLDQIREATVCPSVFESSSSAQSHLDRSLKHWSAGSTAIPDPVSWNELIHSSCEPSLNFQFLSGNPGSWMSQFAQPFAARAPRFETANRQGKPRVGFLVTQGHEKAFLSSIGGVLNQLETNSKDLFVICQHASTGILRTTLNGAIATVDLPRDWNQLVKVLQELQLDVLYYWEIGSDSINYFLPFARMAPIQCTSFGLQFSSGIPSVDFYVSSHWIEPANYQDFYSESVLLGESLLLAREPIQHTAFSPTEDELLIGCLHQIGKFHPDWDATLATILRRSPKAKLVVLADLSGRTAVELQQRFVCTVPDVVDRICFQPRLAKRDYLSLLQRMTLLLDPPVFAGTNSSLDALEIGCPIVSQPGPDQRGRFTLACYRRMQMDTLIAKNTDEYIEMAVRLLHDVDFNRESRRQIHESNHVLFDGPGIVTDYEAILGQLIDVSRRSRGSSLGWDPSSPNQFPN